MTEEEQEVIFDGDDFDYSSEAEQLSDGSGDGDDRQLVNLTEGKTTLKFLSEPSREEWNYGSEEEPDIAVKMVFPVKVVEGSVTVGDETRSAEQIDDDEELYYAVTKGKTESSQWGQLVQVGNAEDGLEGEEVTIFRNGSGVDTNYMVQEAAELKDEE